MNLMNLWNNSFGFPRRVLAAVALICAALLAFGLYLQHVVGLEPCPMCIVQRYAMVLIAVVAGVASTSSQKWSHRLGGLLVLVLSIAGAAVAARQSWLQWYPPEFVNCGRDIYGMIENFPMQRALPMIFKGNGDCSKVDWTFLGGSIANWSFVCFCLIGIAAITLIIKGVSRTQQKN